MLHQLWFHTKYFNFKSLTLLADVMVTTSDYRPQRELGSIKYGVLYAGAISSNLCFRIKRVRKDSCRPLLCNF